MGLHLSRKKLKKPFVLEVRDLWPETLVDLGKFTNKHPLIKVMKWIELSLYKPSKSDYFFIAFGEKYLIQCGVSPSNIIWLPNSVDISAIPDDVKPDNAKFTVMYAGAHGLANDLDTVILAAKILQDNGLADKIHIRLIGEGPDKLRLKKLAETQNVTMIEFLDSVPKNKIYSVMQTADAFLMLLMKSPVFRWGISPNKLFDYLAMSRPVIFGVETPFNPVEKVNAGISVKPSEPEALADAIHHLSLLPKHVLRRDGKRGRKFVLEHHDIVKLSMTLEGMLSEVVEKEKNYQTC